MSSNNPWWAGTLRIVGILLMGLTAVFTLMGGAGTTCVALNPTGYGGKFAGIAPFQWLYILFVLVTVAVGILGVRAVVLLVRRRPGSYRLTIRVLVAGLLVGIIHVTASRLLRGASMPVDMVVYITCVTLIVFLLFRLPGVWRRLELERESAPAAADRSAAAVALAATGLLTLVIQFLMAPTHTVAGVNYADVWHTTLTLAGLAQCLSAVLLSLPRRASARRELVVR